MRITGSSPLPSAVPPQATKGPGRHAAPAPAVDSAPTPAPEASDTEPPVEAKPHGLVRAGEHSNRSDVAALRQWINHPSLRDGLAVPDLAAAEHKGRGFEKAVAAYEGVAPAPPAPAPPVTDPDPMVADPLVSEPGT